MKRFLIFVCAFVTIVAAAYWYWTTTPLYAFQEAAIAVQNRDANLFAQRVDVDTFIDSLLNDLLIRPAATTPGLNNTQRQVGYAAILLAKSSIEEEAFKSVDRLFHHTGMPDLSYLGPDAALAETPTRQVPNNVLNLLRTATHEISGEADKMKTIVYGRMQVWARDHRGTLPGRLLGCPKDARGTELKQILSDYGFKPQNFKGISSYSTTDDANGARCEVGLNFFSPRVHKEVTVEVAILKSTDSSRWRISHISNTSELLLSLGETYESDVHALMTVSLAGISNESLHNEIKSVAKRIENSNAAHDLMQQLKNTFSR